LLGWCIQGKGTDLGSVGKTFLERECGSYDVQEVSGAKVHMQRRERGKTYVF
jgi:hypothetical protein